MRSRPRWLAVTAAFVLGCGGGGGSGPGKTCTLGGKTYAVGDNAPDPVLFNISPSTENGIACTARYCPPDAGADATPEAPVSDASTCALADSFRFGGIGGLREYSDESTITPPDHYKHVRTRLIGEAPTTMACAPALPPCAAGDAINVADIARALRDPDVLAALAQPTPLVYGVDSRPVDGPIYSVMRADGRGFFVGSPCGAPAIDCLVIPRGVQALVDQLRALDQQELAEPDCAMLRP